MLLHFVCREFSSISYISNMFVGINYANLLVYKMYNSNMKWSNMSAKNPASLLYMAFQSHFEKYLSHFHLQSNRMIRSLFCLWLVSTALNQQLLPRREKRKKNRTHCAQNLSVPVAEHGYNNRLRFVIDSMCMLCKRNKTELKHTTYNNKMVCKFDSMHAVYFPLFSRLFW